MGWIGSRVQRRQGVIAVRQERQECEPVPGAGAAVICSAHVNAIGIARSLREVGWNGRILCLNLDGKTALARRWPALCECWDVTLTDPAELFDVLAGWISLEQVSAVFFTDERFLSTFAADGAARLPSARFWVGTECYLEDVLDRRKFYRFLAERGLASVPATVSSAEDPVATFGGEYHIRVWRSWSGMKKLPRGCSIRSRTDLEAWLACCERQGLSREEWGFQELLSTHPQHNVSVCGWHDPEFTDSVITRKIHTAEQIGWLVELVDGLPELKEQAHAILTALEFAGPFELEFLLDVRTGEYKVIELNPRFWMQHRLTAAVGRNSLVRRYLGLAIGQPGARGSRACRFWLDTDEALDRLGSRSGYGLLPYLPRAVWSCPVGGSLWPMVRQKVGSRWKS
jgi:hypothetical protein